MRPGPAGWSPGPWSWPPTAARATPARSVSSSIAGSATATRSARPASPSWRPRASRSSAPGPTRTSPTPSSPSSPPWRWGPTGLTVLGALGGPRVDHALANVGLLSMPALERLGVRLLAADARVRRLRAPAADGGPATLELGGRVGDLRLAAADRGRRRGRHDPRPGLRRCATSRCSRAGRAGSRTSASGPTPRSRFGAANSSSSRPLLRSEHGHADRRRRRSRSRPARCHGHHPRPRGPAWALDRPVLLSQGRHARLHGRGVRVPRRQRDDQRARRRRLGHQPAGGGQQARVQREVRPAVHAARRRGPRRRRRLRQLGREAELRQDLLGRRPAARS